MTKKSKWFLGCGLGCAGLLAVIVTVAVWGISLIQDLTRGIETAEATRRNLEEKFGAPGEFVPASDGSIPAERMEIFLAVREATQEYRSDIARFFSDIPMDERAGRQFDSRPLGEKVRSVLQRIRSAVQMGEDIGHLVEVRNQTLLDRGMGIGEYTYIYYLAYYSWLGHSPTDGPVGNANNSFVRERSQSRTHQDLIKMLSNQLESLSNSGNTEESNQWRSELAGEIEKMKNDDQRVPWQDSVPRKTVESLEPFRDRLEQTYNPIVNPFELSLPKRQGLFSFGRE